MTRSHTDRVSELLPYVSHVLDTALSPDHKRSEASTPGTYLVGWQCGFEPMVVAIVPSYTEAIDADDAEEIARDWLEEIGWFAFVDDCPADFVVKV